MPPPVIAATMTMNKRKMKQPQPQIAALKSADSEPHAIAHPSFEHFAFASIARVNILRDSMARAPLDKNGG